MKSFKLYTRGYNIRTNIKWTSALLTILGLIIASIGTLNYFSFPSPDKEEIAKIVQTLFLREIWIGASIAGIGLIILLTTLFAVGNNHNN